MLADKAAFTGAEQIVRRCLGLTAGQELLIFVDETTIEVGMVIAEAAHCLGVPQMIALVPTALQRRIPKETDLSLLIQGASKDARAILTCVNATPECLPFRERILETQWSARTRIGHMPGASLEVLKLANVDFEQLIADCQCIELVMARGRTLEFVSYTSDGISHCLTVDIGGWGRLPVASDGVISDGVWGNVPSGETYIAPIEGSAEGSIVINGSIPNLVIEPGEEIMLYFERGGLAHIEPPDSPTAQWLDETQIQVAQAKGDRNWSNLAEIGVGVSPAVEHLTGNMIFDEKAASTAHIALGTNTFMGGSVDAAIHCDMVVRRPTIAIDGKTILDHGSLRFVESEWRENYVEVSLEDSPLSTIVMIARSGIRAGNSSDGRLQRLLRSEPGRVSACFVGDDETARLACALYNAIPVEGDWLSIKELVASGKLEAGTIRRILHVIWDYGLINVHPDQGE
jgi:leucyl aminopeptidase (aminopeptidase T)